MTRSTTLAGVVSYQDAEIMTHFTRFSSFPARRVAMLARYRASHGAPLVPGQTDLTHEMGHYLCTLVLGGDVMMKAPGRAFAFLGENR